MSEPAAHPAWAQVANLTPRLKTHLRIHVHTYRGETWYILEDQLNNRFHRFNRPAWRLLERFDGKTTVAAARDNVNGTTAEHDPTGNASGPGSGNGNELSTVDTLGLLSRLHAGDLLDTGLPPSTEALFTRLTRAARLRWQRGMLSPLSVRVALCNPDRFLEIMTPLLRWCTSAWGLWLWLAAIVVGGFVTAGNWAQLVHHFDTRALDPRNVALLWLVYPFVKLLHEFGHGIVVKRYGGAVTEMGVVLLVFMPVPYVDASASTALADKHQRMLVSAAGIMVELALGVAALLAWLHLPPGLASDVAFNVMLVGAGSTLLFNGNPLLRFDGYFVLADALEMPNLAQRSNRFLMHLGQRWLLGLNDSVSPHTGRGEGGWLLSYGLASFFYRTVVLFTIALYVAGKMFFIGVVLACWVLATQLLWPLIRFGQFLVFNPRLQGRRLRPAVVTALTMVATLGLLLGPPIASSTFAHGVVEPPAGSLVRASAAGFVARVLQANGTLVQPGDPLVALEDPVLETEVRRLTWRLRELDREYARAALAERAKGQMLAGLRDQAAAELAEARERLDRLLVRSPAAGIVHFDRPERLHGQFLAQGAFIGRIMGKGAARIRVVVPQEDAALVRADTTGVMVRLASRPAERVKAQLVREVPAATDKLPSRLLGTHAGGDIAVDARDQKGVHALERVFEFELALPGDALGYRPGVSSVVRFEHQPAPLAQQWYRALRQLFLERLEV